MSGEFFDTDFDEWVVTTFKSSGAFTMLFVLLDIGETSVGLMPSSHLHVLGDEIRWPEMARLLETAGVRWSGVVFFRAGREGLVKDTEARSRLSALAKKLHEDRSLIREGEFFDRSGLRLTISEVVN